MDKSTSKEFRDAVVAVVCAIPAGRVTSYGAIARAIGYPHHARLVGRTLSCCSEETTRVPAHRVTDSQGNLSGSHNFGEPDRMQRLLESEGITVRGNRVCGFRSRFWDPMEEIGPDRGDSGIPAPFILQTNPGKKESR